MKKITLIVSCIFLALLAGCQSIGKVDSGIEGVWITDKEKTLESMRASKIIPPDVRTRFETEIWGLNSPSIVLELRENMGRQYLNNEQVTDASPRYSDIQITSVGGNKYIIKFLDSKYGTNNTKALFKEGDCIYQQVVRWGFREYMCRGEL